MTPVRAIEVLDRVSLRLERLLRKTDRVTTAVDVEEELKAIRAAQVALERSAPASRPTLDVVTPTTPNSGGTHER